MLGRSAGAVIGADRAETKPQAHQNRIQSQENGAVGDLDRFVAMGMRERMEGLLESGEMRVLDRECDFKPWSDGPGRQWRSSARCCAGDRVKDPQLPEPP